MNTVLAALSVVLPNTPSMPRVLVAYSVHYVEVAVL